MSLGGSEETLLAENWLLRHQAKAKKISMGQAIAGTPLAPAPTVVQLSEIANCVLVGSPPPARKWCRGISGQPCFPTTKSGVKWGLVPLGAVQSLLKPDGERLAASRREEGLKLPLSCDGFCY